MNFQIRALPADQFAPLFGLSDADLAQRLACRRVVTAKPGTPCRVSMRDADIGETVILLNYQHQPGNSPYRASHAVYVRENAIQAEFAVNEVPDVIRSRLVSVRFFDRDHMMVDAEVVSGEAVSSVISKGFDNAGIAYAHIHNAKPGCFAASVHRVD
jgi:hypothetical protein